MSCLERSWPAVAVVALAAVAAMGAAVAMPDVAMCVAAELTAAAMPAAVVLHVAFALGVVAVILISGIAIEFSDEDDAVAVAFGIDSL